MNKNVTLFDTKGIIRDKNRRNAEKDALLSRIGETFFDYDKRKKGSLKATEITRDTQKTAISPFFYDLASRAPHVKTAHIFPQNCVAH